MRVFVAGATGALGVPVVRVLVADGHEVVGLTRSPSRASIVAKLGARPVIGNALDPESINAAVLSSAPDAVIHALTAIPKRGPLRASDLKATNKLRVVGTRHLLDAAIRAGARRIVVESMAFIYGYGDLGSKPLTEDTPPPTTAPKSWLLPSLRALADEEAQIMEANRAGRIEGIALRFAGFYGPGAGAEIMTSMLRKRLLPVISGTRGRGGPWIHVSDAASATVAALYKGRPGESYNIADDQPARLNDLVEHLANAVGAPHPITIPIWLVRPFAPFLAATWLNTSLIVSNSKAKKQLEWTPCFPSYKEGIAAFVSPAP